MRIKRIGALVILSTTNLFLQSTIAQQNSVLPDYPNNYTMHEDLVKMPDGRNMGSGNAIDVDSKGNIWVFERCGGNPVSYTHLTLPTKA